MRQAAGGSRHSDGQRERGGDHKRAQRPLRRTNFEPVGVVGVVHQRREALAKLDVDRVDHRVAPFAVSVVRSSPWAWASVAAIVPSLTSHAAAISAYEKSPK